MASGHSGDAVRQINRLFLDGTAVGLTDGQLLERFSTRRPEGAEAAFEALVNRHGPMVLRVCRGVLRDPRDVEDAFQATFLVLVKKAHSLDDRELLAPWLYGVARRVALKARGVASRRSRREGGVMDDPPADPAEGPWPDLRPILHEELDRLPEKYRKPVVLCHLEGLTHAEAAQELAWPVGTVSVRLTRARKLLKERLTRRGLGVTASLWAAGLTLDGSSAQAATTVTESLLRSTVKVASAASSSKTLAAGAASAGATLLAQRTLTTMLIARIKWMLVPLALGLGAAGGVVGMRMATPPAPKLAENPPTKPDPLSDLGQGLATNPFVATAGLNPETVPVRSNVLETIPPGFFDVAPLATKDASGPPVIQPGQVLLVEVLEALPGRPITGERVVRPDGTISLGFYGDLKVAGLNRDQIKVKVIEHLRKYVNDEVLGLLMEDAEGRAKVFPPIESSRIFVDESINYLPGGPGRPAQPQVRGAGRLDLSLQKIMSQGRLDEIEGWIHRVVKEMNGIKSSLKTVKAGDPDEPGISDAEQRKRDKAEVDRKVSV